MNRAITANAGHRIGRRIEVAWNLGAATRLSLYLTPNASERIAIACCPIPNVEKVIERARLLDPEHR